MMKWEDETDSFLCGRNILGQVRDASSCCFGFWDVGVAMKSGDRRCSWTGTSLMDCSLEITWTYENSFLCKENKWLCSTISSLPCQPSTCVYHNAILTMSLLPFLAIERGSCVVYAGLLEQVWHLNFGAKKQDLKRCGFSYFQMNSNAVQLKYACIMEQSHLNEPKTQEPCYPLQFVIDVGTAVSFQQISVCNGGIRFDSLHIL